jgi:hypothetical protein
MILPFGPSLYVLLKIFFRKAKKTMVQALICTDEEHARHQSKAHACIGVAKSFLVHMQGVRLVTDTLPNCKSAGSKSACLREFFKFAERESVALHSNFKGWVTSAGSEAAAGEAGEGGEAVVGLDAKL